MKVKEALGLFLTIIGFIVTFIGFCSLDSEQYFHQVFLFTLGGLALFAIGAALLQIFD